jgi:hypothetical protein
MRDENVAARAALLLKEIGCATEVVDRALTRTILERDDAACVAAVYSLLALTGADQHSVDLSRRIVADRLRPGKVRLGVVRALGCVVSAATAEALDRVLRESLRESEECGLRGLEWWRQETTPCEIGRAAAVAVRGLGTVARETVGVLVEWYEQTGDCAFLGAAMRVAPRFVRERVARELVAGDSAMRNMLLLELRGAREAVRLLLRELAVAAGDDDPTVRYNAAWVFQAAGEGSQEVVDALVRLGEDESPDVVQRALYAIGILDRQIESGDVGIERAAVWARAALSGSM